MALLLLAAPLRAQDLSLGAAEGLYAEGSYDEAIRALSTMLQSSLSREHTMRAYRILILSYLRQGEPVEARLTALRLLSLAPDHAPDSTLDPPDYGRLLLEARRALALAGPEDSLRAACEERLQRASERYLEGAFDDVTGVLAGCLESHALRGDRPRLVQASRLVILVHLKQGDLARAHAAAERLLLGAPGYEPDPVQDPPGYTALIALVRRQLAPG